ncbi:Tetratricopeptide-like helical [Moelleriella libera RCEF 2490]|uniref:Tetratricopeptide-like helical n=1 Tax=Moelleriella libera RCEF 2490 TaxID=1081109 RepID=A0A162IKK6_9HYPO|nr:Tetratricopeptide-like helical [Moelleriella libera RCEF 2490]
MILGKPERRFGTVDAQNRFEEKFPSARNIASDDLDGDDDDDEEDNRDEGKETDDDESDEDETVQDLIARQRAQSLEPVKKDKRKAKVSSNKTNTEEQEREQFKRDFLADFDQADRDNRAAANTLRARSTAVHDQQNAAVAMRLLQRAPNGDIQLTSFDDDNAPPYAILSHTWNEGQEVTYHELQAGAGKQKSGYEKIRFCLDRAAEDGIAYCWVDTCCIDKSTSDELSTAINSMFRWYQRAAKCYVYLTDITVPAEVSDAVTHRITWHDAFCRSRWFRRGWTLQELLAPASVEFYSREGKRLGSKITLEEKIQQITKVPLEALRGERHLSTFSVDERISWAAQRLTTKKEDKAYCLLGILGVFLSLIYGEGEEHAMLRLREEVQRRQEGRGIESLQDVAVTSFLPFPRNEFFTGRGDELSALERALLHPDTHRRMTIHGLGGCGKSAFAIEFAYRALARNAKTVVLWVPAISRESFELAYREIGLRLKIHGVTDDNADVKRLVKDALSFGSIRDWLMVIDNADDASVLLDSSSVESTRLYDYLPSRPKGKILFTTRSKKTAERLSPSSSLELKDMDEAQTKELLARRLTKPELLDDETAASQLLESLAYLPLAVIQAAAFINSNDVTVSEYVSLLQARDTMPELFGEHFEDPSRYRELESTVARTWHISFEQMGKQDPLAAEYLSFMACIDRIGIPQSLLPRGGSLPQQTRAIGTLKGYAFITERQQALQERGSARSFDMHRLVHLASGWWLKTQGEWTNRTGQVAARLEELIPYGGHERKEEWTTYLPHAIHLASPDSALEDIAKASLLARIGRCQESLGQHLAAEGATRQAFSLREKVLGPEHPSTMTSMNNLAVALYWQGKYTEAELMHRQKLALTEKVLGPEHRDTLTSISNLASVLDSQGKYEEAESMNQQTLARMEKVLGPEHPDTLTSMSNLAGVLNSQGKYEQAESMNRRTLARMEKVLGPEHPDTLKSMSNLAGVLNSQGKYEQAESINQQTLARMEKVLGPEHPTTLISMSNLANVLGSQGRQGEYEEAELINRETLAQREKVLGREHPDTLRSVYDLAYLLAQQERYNESSVLYERAYTGFCIALGEHHPTTHACREHRAEILTLQVHAQAASSSIQNTPDYMAG